MLEEFKRASQFMDKTCFQQFPLAENHFLNVSELDKLQASTQIVVLIILNKVKVNDY
tara:strand:- start:67973 stop:68143 length:171 start_codon:yes stop_codon:yes gene_type:complete